RLAIPVPCSPKYRPDATWAPEGAGAAVTAPARSGWLTSTPSPSTATVTPAPCEAAHAPVKLSELSHHSLCPTGSALAGTAARPIEAAAVPAAISAMAGRGNLSGTPSLPSMIGTGHCATFKLFACYLREARPA